MEFNILLIANAVSLVGTIVMVSVGVIKKKSGVLIGQCIAFSLLGAGYLMLGGLSGAIVNAVAVLRNILAARVKFRPVYKYSFIAIQIVLTIIFNKEGIIGWYPCIGNCIFTWFLDDERPEVLKYVIIGTAVFWLRYDLKNMNYTAAIFEVVNMVTNTIGVILIKRTQKKEKENKEIVENKGD